MNPLLRGPLLACALMGLSSGLVGVLSFVRRRSLLGEALSHASYPGVVLAVGTPLAVLFGAGVSACVGLLLIEYLGRRIRQDSALTFVLATLFGLGILLASRMQFAHPAAYRTAISYLYGQAATMGDFHIIVYALLALLVIMFIFLGFKELQAISFDRAYAASQGLRVSVIDLFSFVLLVFAVVIGVRSVGVVLMSAMLIAPPVAARQWTHRLGVMFLLSSLLGAVSGFFGGWLSFATKLPTGPAVVLVASGLAFASLLWRLFCRAVRIGLFRQRVACENVLKALWHGRPPGRHLLAFWQLRRQGWVQGRSLTSDGEQRAARIVRLHRLWEVYLVEKLGIGAARVHKSAEEMEHIITPELEAELKLILDNPKQDPHNQPIPGA